MNFASKLNDRCVWWPKTGTLRTGQATYGPPTELRCHWEDNTGATRPGPTGEEWTSKAEVFLDAQVGELDVLWCGKLADAVQDSPLANPGAASVRQVERIPSVRSRQRLWTAYL